MPAPRLYQLAACAETLWLDKPLAWRAAALHERGLAVGLWNHDQLDLPALQKTSASFSIMNGFLQGRLGDAEGAAALLQSAQDAIDVGKQLGVKLYNLHGTRLGEGGIPEIPCYTPDDGMRALANDTLQRIADLAEQNAVIFTLENLNQLDHPGCPFSSTKDVLALVSVIDRPSLGINLDLYHTQNGEGDLIRWCRQCLPWAKDIQVADNPGRCEPGSGEINYRAVADALREVLYDGLVTFEGYASTSAETALDKFEDVFLNPGTR